MAALRTQVTYPYRTEQEESGFILGPIDLTSERTGVHRWGNGSGKSTLAKLITGLHS